MLHITIVDRANLVKAVQPGDGELEPIQTGVILANGLPELVYPPSPVEIYATSVDTVPPYVACVTLVMHSAVYKLCLLKRRCH